MNPFVPALIAMLTIFGAGLGTSMLFLRHARRIAVAELIALSWLFGTLVVSLGLCLLGIGLRGAALQVALTIFCLALAVVGFVLLRRGKERLELPRSKSWVERILALLICLQIGAVFFLTFKDSLSWDGLFIWEIKARYAFLNGGALPVEYFSDASRAAFSHPEYPLYLPMLETWLYFWIGDCDQYWVKLIFPVFYATGVLLLAQAGSSWSTKRWIGLLAANLFFCVPFLTRAEGGIITGYVDVPLSVVYLAAFYFLSIFAQENSKAALGIFVALGAMLPWMKRDGVVLWSILAACGAWMIWRRRGVVPAICSLLPGIGVLAGWRIYLSQMHVHTAVEFLSITPSAFASNFHRLLPVTHSLLKELATIEHWSLLWCLTLPALLSLAWRDRGERTLTLCISTVLPVALYCFAYLFSAWPNYLNHLEHSLPRLLLHVAPLSILSIALALAPPPTTESRQRPG